MFFFCGGRCWLLGATIYHLERRWRKSNCHILVDHGPLGSHLFGVAIAICFPPRVSYSFLVTLHSSVSFTHQACRHCLSSPKLRGSLLTLVARACGCTAPSAEAVLLAATDTQKRMPWPRWQDMSVSKTRGEGKWETCTVVMILSMDHESWRILLICFDSLISLMTQFLMLLNLALPETNIAPARKPSQQGH